jgi:hypothetical protein
MKNPQDLSHDQLVQIVRLMQDLLYQDPETGLSPVSSTAIASGTPPTFAKPLRPRWRSMICFLHRAVSRENSRTPCFSYNES